MKALKLTDPEKPKGNRRLFLYLVFIGLFFSPVLYLFSAGPAVYLWKRGFIPQRVFKVVYAPVERLVQVDSVREPLMWYYSKFW